MGPDEMSVNSAKRVACEWGQVKLLRKDVVGVLEMVLFWRQSWCRVDGGLKSGRLFDWLQVQRDIQDGGGTSLSDCVV